MQACRRQQQGYKLPKRVRLPMSRRSQPCSCGENKAGNSCKNPAGKERYALAGKQKRHQNESTTPENQWFLLSMPDDSFATSFCPRCGFSRRHLPIFLLFLSFSAQTRQELLCCPCGVRGVEEVPRFSGSSTSSTFTNFPPTKTLLGDLC